MERPPGSGEGDDFSGQDRRRPPTIAIAERIARRRKRVWFVRWPEPLRRFAIRQASPDEEFGHWLTLFPARPNRKLLTAEQRERKRACDRAYWARRSEEQIERDRARHRASNRVYRAAHPEAKRAHDAVRAALRRGKLVRQPCERCGNAASEAHHPDYTRRLDVQWLCKECHRAVHRKSGGHQ